MSVCADMSECGAVRSDLPQMDREVCRDVCLFCLADLPPGMSNAGLENVVPYGPDLVLRLDRPAKNKEAFDSLCGMLNIKWTSRGAVKKFDLGQSLPLCFQCQNLYQELYQLQVQIRELGRLMKGRLGLITEVIRKSEKKRGNDGLGATKFSYYGLDYLREKVVGRSSSSGETVADLILPQPDQRDDVAYIKNEIIDAAEADDSNRLILDECSWQEGDTDDVEHATSIQKFKADSPPSFKQNQAANKAYVNDRDPSYLPSKRKSSSRIAQSKRPRNQEEFASVSDSDYVDKDDHDENYSEEETKTTRPSTQTQRTSPISKVSRKDPHRKHSEQTAEKPHECGYCLKRFTTKKSRNNHQKWLHEGKGGQFPCTTCGKTFVTQGHLRHHENSHNETVVFCKTCGKCYKSKLTFYKHNRDAHQGKSECSGPVLNPTEEVLEALGVEVESGTKTPCHICSKEIHGKVNIRKHFDEFHDGHPLFKCATCGKEFTSYKDTRRHAQRHTDRKPFQCDKCPRNFHTAPELNNHSIAHLPYSEKPKPKSKNKKVSTTASDELDESEAKVGSTCHICDEMITAGRNAFLQHYEEKHPDEKRYTCKYCQEHFKGLWEVRSHQRKHTGDKPHECKHCFKRFTTKKSRNNHQKWIHEGGGNRFTCETCGKMYPTRSLLNTHFQVHNETVVFCRVCGKTYKSEYSFNKHNKDIHEGKAECTVPLLNPTEKDVEALGVEANTKTACHICWKNIHGKVNIKKHFDEFHDGHPPLKCLKCWKQFTYYKEIRKHALRHLGAKGIQCDKCPKRFHTNTELRNHSVTHLSDSEKPKFVCEICGVSYTSKGNLSLHYKVHDGTRPRWVCEICGKSYSERKGYHHHKKSVHLNETPHKCSHCPKSFVGPSELVKHLRIHMRQKPFKCPLCDKHFPYTNSRSRHVREVHYNEKNRNRGFRRKHRVSAAAASWTPNPNTTNTISYVPVLQAAVKTDEDEEVQVSPVQRQSSDSSGRPSSSEYLCAQSLLSL